MNKILISSLCFFLVGFGCYAQKQTKAPVDSYQAGFDLGKTLATSGACGEATRSLYINTVTQASALGYYNYMEGVVNGWTSNGSCHGRPIQTVKVTHSGFGAASFCITLSFYTMKDEYISSRCF